MHYISSLHDRYEGLPGFRRRLHGPSKRTSDTAKHEIFSYIWLLLNAFVFPQGFRTQLRIRQPNSILINSDLDIYLSSLTLMAKEENDLVVFQGSMLFNVKSMKKSEKNLFLFHDVIV
jgi:hypothetical protein